jgi:hypothetical protein
LLKQGDPLAAVRNREDKRRYYTSLLDLGLAPWWLSGHRSDAKEVYLALEMVLEFRLLIQKPGVQSDFSGMLATQRLVIASP